MAKETLTVICRESGSSYDSDILIYTVEADKADAGGLEAAVVKARENDLGFEVEMEVLFAFAGDLMPVLDWRG